MKKFKIIKIDHIAIATKESKKINDFFLNIFSDSDYKQEIVDSEKVITSFFCKHYFKQISHFIIVKQSF